MKKQVEAHQQIIVSPLEEIMGERFGRYSKYIIQDRALPDARDGLKPVQRRILYTMYMDGNTPDKPYRKSVKSVGLVIGNYHPHGDSSVYDAMVRMSQNWKAREPQIDMHGNNGSMDDDPAAAMRYTEARLAPIAMKLLNDIEKDTVNFSPNFDDTDTEPTVLPARYPNLLVNGISGIAAGYATNIPPHNLSEVIDATIYRIEHKQCSVEDVMTYIQGPDFPTGGIVQGKEGIKEAYHTGKGKIMIRSKVEIVQTKTNQQLLVHEIPYEVVKANMVKKIDDIRLNKKIDGIMDVRDESDRNGLRIVIDIKKDADAQLILNYLYKNTDLQVAYNYNIVAIVNKRPMQLGLLPMLDTFIVHRRDVITRRSHFDLDKMEKRCHIVEGLIECISVLDEIIYLIRTAKDKADAKVKIIGAFQFSEAQAEAIVTLRLYRLSNTDIQALQEEYESLQEQMAELQKILNDEKRLKKEIIKELKEVKKEFGSHRLTNIEEHIEEIVIDKVAMIQREQVMATISKDGYIKKVSMRSYAAASEQMTGIKEGDTLIGYQEVNTLDTILFFTNCGTYGYAFVYEIEEGKWKEVGSHINSVVKMRGEEKITNAYAISSFHTSAYMISVTRLGMIKKTALKDYEVSRHNKTMNNMNLYAEDEVIGTYVAYEYDEILIASKEGYVTRYPISLIPTTSPKSKGVKAMNLVEDEIVSAAIYHGDQAQLVVISEAGATKRIKLSEIDITGRPTKGNRICKKVKSNPYYVKHICVCNVQDDLSIVQDSITSYKVKDISSMSKETTFSNTLSLTGDFSILQGILKIEKTENEFQQIEEEKTSLDEQLNLDL